MQIQAAKVKRLGPELVVSLDDDIKTLQGYIATINELAGNGDPNDELNELAAKLVSFAKEYHENIKNVSRMSHRHDANPKGKAKARAKAA